MYDVFHFNWRKSAPVVLRPMHSGAVGNVVNPTRVPTTEVDSIMPRIPLYNAFIYLGWGSAELAATDGQCGTCPEVKAMQTLV